MGCDIHTFVEIKSKYKSEPKEWSDGNFYRKNTEFSDSAEEGTTSSEPEYWRVSAYIGRNYTLFALLADVRNYDDIEPIDYPRGVPDDCSKACQKELDAWGVDSHSHSYFTLTELLDYFETQEQNKLKNAILNQPSYHHLLTPLIKNLEFIAKDARYEVASDNDIRVVFWFDN